MSLPFRKEADFAEISEVNVVPLADVSLVLLIILMVISPMMEQAMLMLRTAAQSKDAPLPKQTQPLPPPSKQDLVLVVALGNDAISVGDQRFDSIARFMGYMSGAIAARTDKKVFLSPAPDVSNGKVVNMLELLKQLGAQSVALVQSADQTLETPPPLPVQESVPSSVGTSPSRAAPKREFGTLRGRRNG